MSGVIIELREAEPTDRRTQWHCRVCGERTRSAIACTTRLRGERRGQARGTRQTLICLDCRNAIAASVDHRLTPHDVFNYTSFDGTIYLGAGEYAGRTICDIPRSYALWMRQTLQRIGAWDLDDKLCRVLEQKAAS